MSEPRISFVIGGVQKAGTTALAHYLASQPGIALPDRLPGGMVAPSGFEAAWTKEAHVFDAPGFDDRWGVADVDRRFAMHFSDFEMPCIYGDATPVYVFHPQVVERIARYNPRMRWVLLLRDPVERAVSQYRMERARGNETRSLLRAVLTERRRLEGSWGDFAGTAPWRLHGYAERSRYSVQVCRLLRHFPASQILVLPSAGLAKEPERLVAEIRAFLGLPPCTAVPRPERLFEGAGPTVSRLSPGRLALRWKLRAEVRAWSGFFAKGRAHQGCVS